MKACVFYAAEITEVLMFFLAVKNEGLTRMGRCLHTSHHFVFVWELHVPGSSFLSF